MKYISIHYFQHQVYAYFRSIFDVFGAPYALEDLAGIYLELLLLLKVNRKWLL